jgi:hypothetical protein
MKGKYVKVSVRGIETWKDMSGESRDDRWPFLRVPDSLFEKWFEIRRNSKNAPVHTFRGRGMEDIVKFMGELVDHYKGRGVDIKKRYGNGRA